MKNIMVILTLLLFSNLLHAQGGSLQFKEVIYKEISVAPVEITIINNTVLKITSAIVDNYSGNIYFREDSESDFKFFCYGGDATNRGHPFPFWLPEGTYWFKTGTSSYNGAITGIVFNVVQ